MPTYVYECKKCEKVFEAEQRIVEDPLTDCDCGAKGALKRLIQPTAVIFNGTGFHINDYKGTTPAKTETPTKSDSCDSTGACPACTPADTTG